MKSLNQLTLKTGRFSLPAQALDAAAVAMLMPKKTQIAIYELLFKEEVMVAKKDAQALQSWRQEHAWIFITEAMLSPQTARLHEGTVYLETLLLVPHQ